MKLTRRLYLNPVLTNEKDDYLDSIFETNYSYEMSGVNSLSLKFNITLTNQDLEDLIVCDKASYIIHLECSKTGFRKIVKSDVKEFTYEIPINEINGALEILSFIVATQDIDDFYSDDWNEDYETAFSFKKGTVLAYDTLNTLDVTKDNYEFKNASSIFKIRHILTDEKKTMQIELNFDKICIELCTKDYNLYKKICNNDEYQPLIHSMFIFPALIYVFEELRQESGIEENQFKRWFISLTNSYKTRGIDLVSEIQNEDKTSVQLAQEAFDDVIGKALQSLINLGNFTEEED